MHKKLYTLFLLLSFTPLSAMADDIEIYGISRITMKPNVLIVFDSSTSMSTKDVPADSYDKSKTYSGRYYTDAIYFQARDYSWKYFGELENNVCSKSKTPLTENGYWRGYVKKDGSRIICSSSYYTWRKNLRTGNYLNFEEEMLDTFGVSQRSRMGVAKNVIAKLIYDNHDKVKFGLMKFNPDPGRQWAHGGTLVEECKADNYKELIGNYNTSSPPIFENRAVNGYGVIGKLYGDSWTPLGETLTEAGLYLAGKQSWFHRNKTYNSPIEYRCQPNYIIVITDGAPTADDDGRLRTKSYLANRTIPSYAKDGKFNYLDDVAYFLKNTDIRPDLGSATSYPNQTATTYTIGFKTKQDLLQKTADNGGGHYYTADTASALNEALKNIFVDIAEENDNFSGAAVPASQANNVYTSNYVYYGMFQPQARGMWLGNIKKYQIRNGKILDQNGDPATENGVLKSSAQSYWSTVTDGNTTTTGGAAQVLAKKIRAGGTRNIYTYTGMDSTLTAASNSFTSGNSRLTAVNSETISLIRRENSSLYPLADFLHSRPQIIHYDNGQTVIYAGSNGGMFHAFDDKNGEELWSYVPPNLWNKLYLLEGTNQKSYFVDGNSSDFTVAGQKYIFFGQRRGGSTYTALNITTPLSPLLAYTIEEDFLGSDNELLGQSWGAGDKVSIIDPTDKKAKLALLLPGGYDSNQDKLSPIANDSKGRAIFAIAAETGKPISGSLFQNKTLSEMTHSIVALAGFENPKSSTTTRIYAGDMNGNLFAFRDDIYSNNQSLDGSEDGKWEQKIKLFSSPGRKIFYPPNIVNEKYQVKIGSQNTERIGDYVFYGTGDRAHPNRKDIENRLYAIKNSWSWSSSPNIVEAKLVIAKSLGLVQVQTRLEPATVIAEAKLDTLDFTVNNNKDFILDLTGLDIKNLDLSADNLVKGSTASIYNKSLNAALALSNNKGWFFRLVNSEGKNVGEKIVSTPTIYAGTVYFSTYVPASNIAENDPCSSTGNKGTGYLYAVNYQTGMAVNDYNKDNSLTRDDRRKQLSTSGIPPQPVITIQEDGANIITGLDIEKPAVNPKLLRRYWQQLNVE